MVPPSDPLPKTTSDVAPPSEPSSLARLLAIATDNLDLLRLDGLLIVQLEVDILYQEGPDLITEPIGIKMALRVA
jgi:hypothetical protein